MKAHHRQVIERLTEQFGEDPQFPALIVGGSVAKGWERDDSDIDFMLLATDEVFARRKAEGDLIYFDDTICDYEGGYVDGKIIDMQFLLDVADHGSEPARMAFAGAFLAYSRVPELANLLKRIPVYSLHEQVEKTRAFYSQIMLLNWFVGEAEKRGDAYLMTRAVADLVLYGGRLILAHNKILYPYHKWLMRAVREAPEKPDDFIALAEQLLARPCKETAQQYCDCIRSFRDWGVTFPEAVNLFLKYSEWNWRDGRPPLPDW